MSHNGWLKFHRQIIENPMWRRDHTAMYVFLTLLALVDRETGTVTLGRSQLAHLTGINESTIYKASLRLKRGEMVNTKSNSQYTEYRICNWSKYQSDGNSQSTNEVTAKYQQSNTKQEVRSKKREIVRDTNVSVASPQKIDRRNPELQELIDHAATLHFPLQGTIRANRFAAAILLKKRGLDHAKRLVEAAVAAHGKDFAPNISDFPQLNRKQGDLLAYFSKQKGKENSYAPLYIGE